MFSRIILMSCLCIGLMSTPKASAELFQENSQPQKQQSGKPPIPQKQLLPITMTLPPLPGQQSKTQKTADEATTGRWELVGKIEDRLIVTDTRSGEVISLAEGAQLPDGCVATSVGIVCDKGAADKKLTPRVEKQAASDESKQNELVRASQELARKCMQLNDTNKTEIARLTALLKEREAVIERLSKDITEIRTQKTEQVVSIKQEQPVQPPVPSPQPMKTLQVQEATPAESQQIDEDALLDTSIAKLKKNGAMKNRPAIEGKILKNADGKTIVLDLK